MEQKDVTSQIAKFISDNSISVEGIMKETNIERKKLISGGEKLTASELLELCAYLGIRPEDYYEKKLPF